MTDVSIFEYMPSGMFVAVAAGRIYSKIEKGYNYSASRSIHSGSSLTQSTHPFRVLFRIPARREPCPHTLDLHHLTSYLVFPLFRYLIAGHHASQVLQHRFCALLDRREPRYSESVATTFEHTQLSSFDSAWVIAQ